MIQTKLNYNPATFPGKDCSKQPSLTVPDQTMSLRVILERYAKGLPLVGNPAQPIYTPEEDLESSLGVDLRTLDLSEIKELKDSVNQEVREIKGLSQRSTRTTGLLLSNGGHRRQFLKRESSFSCYRSNITNKPEYRTLEPHASPL